MDHRQLADRRGQLLDVGEQVAPVGVVAQEIEELLRKVGQPDRCRGELVAQRQGARPPLAGRRVADAAHPGLECRQLVEDLADHRGLIGDDLVRIAGQGLEHRRGTLREPAQRAAQRGPDRARARLVDLALGQRIAQLADLVEVEQLARPVGADQHAARPLGGVPHADLVVDVAVGDRQVRDHQIGEVEALDHVPDDHRAEVLIGPDGLVAQLLDRRQQRLFPQAVEIDPGRCGRLGAGLLDAEGHDHEADRLRHRGPSGSGSGAPTGPTTAGIVAGDALHVKRARIRPPRSRSHRTRGGGAGPAGLDHRGRRRAAGASAFCRTRELSSCGLAYRSGLVWTGLGRHPAGRDASLLPHSVMGYRELSESRLSGYLASLPEIAARLGSRQALWQIRKVAASELSTVFVVEGPAGDLCVKQALPEHPGPRRQLPLVARARRLRGGGADALRTLRARSRAAGAALRFRARAARPGAAQSAPTPARGPDQGPGLSALRRADRALPRRDPVPHLGPRPAGGREEGADRLLLRQPRDRAG